MKARIKLNAISHTSHEVMAAQARQAVARGIPLVRKLVTDEYNASGPLAIVGGGHPIDLPGLKAFTGPIWAVNGMHDWLLDRDIRSTLYMADPHPAMAEYATRAESAVLSSSCHPSVFDALEGKRVNIFHFGGMVDDAPFEARGVCTAASRAHMVGLWMGYTQQHYFGCSGSYVDVGRDAPADSHVFQKSNPEYNHPQELIIQAAGEYYRTNLALMQQSEFFAEIFTEFPDYFVDRSCGLLRAMMQDPEWEVTHISDATRDCMTPESQDGAPTEAMAA